MKNKKFVSGMIIFIVLVVIAFAVVLFNISNPQDHKISINTSNIGHDNVALLYVTGTIEDENSTYNQEWLLKTINNLKSNDHNEGILLYINSPGGGVYQADAVYLALQDYKTSGKKIYAYMGPLAASGGYYIACAADKIYANRNTLTGSIGVISGQSFDLTGFFAKNGIKSETIHAGKNKNMGNYNEPLTDEQRTILQSIADECYEQFVSIVSTQRKMSYNDVCKLADGRIYTAKQALDNGLIDSIDSIDEAMRALKEDELDNEDLKTVVYKYERKQTFRSMLLGSAVDIYNKQAAAKLGLPEAVLDDINGFNTYPAYLYK